MWLGQLFTEPGGEGSHVSRGEVGAVAVDKHIANHGRTLILEAHSGRRVDQPYALDLLCCVGVDLRVVEGPASRGGALLQMVERGSYL